MNRIRLLLSSAIVGLLLAACGTSELDPGPVVPSVSVGSPALVEAVPGEAYEFTLSASGVPLGVDSVTFAWSVNGVPIGESVAGASGGVAVAVFVHSFADEGEYEVDVTLRGRDDEDLASRSVTVTVTAAPNYSRFSDPVSYVAGESPHSVTVADLDDDGHLDIIVVASNHDAVSILWGAGSRQAPQLQQLTTPVNPKHAAVADFNGDGCLDIAVAVQDGVHGGTVDEEHAGMVTVFLSQGTTCGTFAAPVDYEACGRPHHVAAGTFNSAGNVDLVVACWNRNEIAVLPGVGDGTFGAPLLVDSGGGNPHSVVVADFDGDGSEDIAVAAFGTSRATVLLASGDHTFAPPAAYVTGSSPHGIKAADINGDGRPDLITANQASDDISVLLNNGSGVFSTQVRYSVGVMPKDLALGDLDGDGVLDIVVVNSAGNHPDGDTPTDLTVLYGTGDGRFEDSETIPLDLTPFSVEIVDLDADGFQDVITANWGSGDVKVLFGREPAAQNPSSPQP